MSEAAELSAANVEVKGGVVAYLSLEGAAKAAALYEKAFGAVVVAQHPLDEKGRTMHVHLYINGSSVMLSDFYPEHGFMPEKASGFNLMLPVTDIDAWFKRAVAAGCAPEMPPAKMFWGDIYGQVRDPFGVLWSMNQGA